MKKLIALLLSLVVLAGCGTPSGSQHTAQDQPKSRASASAKGHTELAGLY